MKKLVTTTRPITARPILYIFISLHRFITCKNGIKYKGMLWKSLSTVTEWTTAVRTVVNYITYTSTSKLRDWFEPRKLHLIWFTILWYYYCCCVLSLITWTVIWHSLLTWIVIIGCCNSLWKQSYARKYMENSHRNTAQKTGSLLCFQVKVHNFWCRKFFHLITFIGITLWNCGKDGEPRL